MQNKHYTYTKMSLRRLTSELHLQEISKDKILSRTIDFLCFSFEPISDNYIVDF